MGLEPSLREQILARLCWAVGSGSEHEKRLLLAPKVMQEEPEGDMVVEEDQDPDPHYILGLQADEAAAHLTAQDAVSLGWGELGPTHKSKRAAGLGSIFRGSQPFRPLPGVLCILLKMALPQGGLETGWSFFPSMEMRPSGDGEATNSQVTQGGIANSPWCCLWVCLLHRNVLAAWRETPVSDTPPPQSVVVCRGDALGRADSADAEQRRKAPEAPSPLTPASISRHFQAQLCSRED